MVKQVGHWVLRSVLGHGSFGEVHLGTHTESGKRVAVKVCTKQMLAKGQGRALLQREIATMKALDHNNVLRLYEVLETTKRFYLVIELATNGELFSLIKNDKGFDDPTARSYFRQLSDGVHYCHEQGVVHRDLKPQNLLLTADNTLKIADFGFSRFQDMDENGQVSKSLRLQTQCGTPNYAAPEIFLGQGYDGFKTDIWACGVILYVMLSGGVVPFKPQGGNGLQGVIMSIVQGAYTIPDNFSAGATSLIKRILVTDPGERATMHEIFRHAYVRRGAEPADGEDVLGWRIPKIVVSEDQVRNSIVKTNDEEEYRGAVGSRQAAAAALLSGVPGSGGGGGGSGGSGGGSPSSQGSGSPHAHRARGATFSTSTLASTLPVNLGGRDVAPLGAKKASPRGTPTHADPHRRSPPNTGSGSPTHTVSATPAALLSEAASSTSSAAQQPPTRNRQRLASFNTLGSGPCLDMEPLAGAGSPMSPATPASPGFSSTLGSSSNGAPLPPAAAPKSPQQQQQRTLQNRASRSRTMVVENSQDNLGGHTLPPQLQHQHPHALATGAASSTAPGDEGIPSTRTNHVFKRKHWNVPRWCFYCGKCIYGVGKQGFSCILCECPVHIKCVDASSQNSCCEQYRARQSSQK